MTNKEYLKSQVPLWLFNKLVWEPYKDSSKEYTTLTSALVDLDLSAIRSNVEDTNFSLVDWSGDSAYINRYIKSRWSQNKDFLFPCSVEEALSILEIVEPEFYQFLNARKRNPRLVSTTSNWFGEAGVFSLSIQPWDNTPDGISYWVNKKDFSLSPQWIAEKTVVAKPEPKTIGEWLDLPENALIKEIAEFDHRIHDKQGILVTKLTKDLSDLFYDVPTGDTQVYKECKSQESFQPYIDWYEKHPKNPKNVTPVIALKDVRESHSLEWWRDELAKAEPEVASYLYAQYGLQGRTSQNPRKLFGDDYTSFLGGFGWSSTELKHDVHSECNRQESFQPLKEALAAKKTVTIVDLTSSQMRGATFPCTMQERLDWMLTQPSLKPIARFIINDGTYRSSREVHGEFTNDRGDSFAYWATGKNVIEQDCNRAKSWEPFYKMYPHLRVKTVKPVELKKINEHRQLLVECANIKEVKQLLKHINQESAFTHSARLVVFYDLDEKKAYHVGNTKKSQWKQVKNKVHKKVTLEQFLAEVPMVNLAADRKPRLGASERPARTATVQAVKTSSWFEDVPIEPKVNTKSWFD